jgi:hypothetical protein
VIEEQFEEGFEFSDDGLAMVREGNLYGFIDTTGEFAIEPQFTRASTFSEGLAAAQVEDGGLVGYVDTTGEFVIEPRYQQVGPFQEGLAAVFNGQQFLYIDTEGEVVWQTGAIDTGGGH